MILIDCTFRDGGYYNNWDFSKSLIEEYLVAMDAAAVDIVELGFRTFDDRGFKGGCAYTTDDFIRSLKIPAGLKVGVMVNASELVKHTDGALTAAQKMFVPASESPVDVVRIACHAHEFEATLPACAWLKEAGYTVGINLMQIADRSADEILRLSEAASRYPLDALYFADSLGSLGPDQTVTIIQLLRTHWKGAVGIHAHDNMGRAVANTLKAIENGVTWVDSTVTGMGRGPGNAQTEYVVIELDGRLRREVNHTPLLELIRHHFRPMQNRYGWGSNPYYYIAGKNGIHPTYVQEMLGDPRYKESDILAVLDHLRGSEGKKFNIQKLEAGRQMYGGIPSGSWSPSSVMQGREVLILGSGPGVEAHRDALQRYIKKNRPFVVALNTQTVIDADLIDVRAACHPFRLFADCQIYPALGQPLVMPWSRLPSSLREKLQSVPHHDYGLAIQPGKFEFHETGALVPNSLVITYVLAMAASGKAQRVLLAGFDGYGSDDSRTEEMEALLSAYQAAKDSVPLLAITPTCYRTQTTSVYAL